MSPRNLTHQDRPSPIGTVCIFAGASPGAKPEYASAARALGRALVRRGKQVVFGGGACGLMGVVADEVLDQGGSIVGVIPEDLARKELAHQGLTRLEVVRSMHERKHRMATLADAFIALPGGIGTFEEFFEVLTWTQLCIHNKPVALYNCYGYYDRLIEFLAHATREQFMTAAFEDLLLSDDEPNRLLSRIDQWQRTQSPQ